MAVTSPEAGPDGAPFDSGVEGPRPDLASDLSADGPSQDASCSGSDELCDGDDDDCNGVTDNGCPSGVGLSTAIAGPTFGGSGGSSFTRACATGRALVGFDGLADESGSDATVHGLTPLCSPITFATVAGSPEDSFAVRATGSSALASVGGNDPDVTPTPFGERCGSNQVVIGINGRAGDVPASTVSVEVERFGFVCGTVTIARSGGAGTAWEITVTRTTNSAQHGGSTTTPFEYVCPAGWIATAIGGRTGWRIDAIRLSCAPVVLQTL